MKEKHSGIMVSFTFGTAVGLYATSKEARESMNRLGQKIFGSPQRQIIEGEYKFFDQRASRSFQGVRRFGQSLKNHISAASRARIIRKNQKK